MVLKGMLHVSVRQSSFIYMGTPIYIWVYPYTCICGHIYIFTLGILFRTGTYIETDVAFYIFILFGAAT